MDIFVAIIGFAAVLAGIILLLKRKGTERFWGILPVLGGLAAIVFTCVVSVPTGHTGVVTTFGSVENYTYEAGLHVKAPWQEVVKMDNRVQKSTLDLPCFSSDIQAVVLTYTVNYQIKKSDAQNIYRSIGVSYYSTVIDPSISECVKEVTAKYTAENLIANRSGLSAQIEEALSQKLAAFNIELVSTSIENMDFTDAFEAAVEEKEVAQQEKLKAKTKAEQSVIEAQAAAEIKKIDADAYAYEIKTKADAEAEANAAVASSLSKDLIDYTYAKSWDGKMPTVAGSGTPIMDISTIMPSQSRQDTAE